MKTKPGFEKSWLDNEESTFEQQWLSAERKEAIEAAIYRCEKSMIHRQQGKSKRKASDARQVVINAANTKRQRKLLRNAERLSNDALDAKKRRYGRAHFDQILKRDNGRCKWCNVKIHRPKEFGGNAFSNSPNSILVTAGRKTRVVMRATLDHVIPLSQGGLDRPDNIVSACFDCNQRRNEAAMVIKRKMADIEYGDVRREAAERKQANEMKELRMKKES